MHKRKILKCIFEVRINATAQDTGDTLSEILHTTLVPQVQEN